MAARPVPMMRTPYQSRALMGVYRPHETNYCPSCGQSNWYVGRVAAQCGRCETALPLASTVMDMAAERDARAPVRRLAS